MITMKMKTNDYILLSGMSCWILCNTAWIWFGEPLYYYGVAFMIASTSVVIYRLNRNLLSTFFVFFAFNNLVDELFFDPTKIEINEYLFCLFYLVLITWRFYRKRSNFLKNQ